MKTLVNYDKEKLEKVCKGYGLSLVVLHGSYATGITTPHSDIAVGFLGEPDVVEKRYFDIVADLTGIFGDKCDPVAMNGAESMISFHIARCGLPLYEKTRGLFNAFKVGAISRYIDTKKFRLLEKEYVRSAIKKQE